jgi:hypothetical protein
VLGIFLASNGWPSSAGAFARFAAFKAAAMNAEVIPRLSFEWSSHAGKLLIALMTGENFCARRALGPCQLFAAAAGCGRKNLVPGRPLWRAVTVG